MGSLTVAIVGAGATGGYLAARLARSGVDVALYARGESLRTVSERGLHIRGPGDLDIKVRPARVLSLEDADKPADLTLFCVKGYDTGAVAPGIGRVIGETGRILCLQNGVHNEDILSRLFGRDRVLPGVLYIGAERTGPGDITCSSPPRVVFGTQGTGSDDLRAAILSMFESAGIECSYDAEILASKWQKFIFNCGLNPLTTLTARRLGFLLAHAQGEKLFLELVDEAIAAGRAAGAPLRPDVRERVIEVGHRMDISSSMAEDLAVGNAIENEAFSGHVCRLGEAHNVPTPVTRVFYDILAMADPAMSPLEDQT